ncbi:MAG TPA: NAD(P)/FAD-dependent oxidoreductase [Myxococcaceae bacterium]|nr:NAD(P)/FAD-dependent oxidoreductase [Myxococcaceae bacterium]
MRDVVILGGGHNGLVASVLLARKGLKVTVVESRPIVGGAAVTEFPFTKAPRLGTSTGAYLLGLMPPELMAELKLDLELHRRDPHYFLPTTDKRYLLFGSNEAELRRQFVDYFSEADWNANQAMNAELAAIRDDLAPAWLQSPYSLEETAERFIRPALRQAFIRLCRGSAREYLERWNFKSDLVKAMYAITDAFSGLHAGYDTPGGGMNLLVHNMCRLPGSGGTWMIVGGGMGAITQGLAKLAQQAGAEIRTSSPVARILSDGNVVRGVALESGEELLAKVVVSNADPFKTMSLVGEERLPKDYVAGVNRLRTDGTTFKLNLALKGLPRFTCLPEDRGQFGPTIHLMPDERVVLSELERAYREVTEGKLPEFPSIEWYIHTTVDPSLRDPDGHHNSALFVQWVPYELKGTTWEQQEEKYAKHLLSVCDRFAPGTSDLVVDMFALSPAKVEKYFGITRGHIHHVDNKYGFNERPAYRMPMEGLYLCGAGCHPAGSVIGASGHNAAQQVLKDLALA